VSATDDRDVLDPAIEEGLKHHDKLRLLYVLGKGFGGYSSGALWEDAKLGMRQWHAWERVAVVTDRGWIHDSVKAFAWMIPARVRVFPVDRRDEGRDWVTAAD